MNELVLKTNNLTKKYHDTLAVSDVCLSLHKGEIYGLIGENGAGKTTLLRMITGLSTPTAGSIELFSESNPHKMNKARSRIGYVTDTCALFPEMSAVQNLEIRRAEWGIPGKKCIEEVLSLVKLSDVGKKKVRNYSLGMKQRLGLAVALLGEPEFLILDEPINGLDPTGIIELRTLLKKLNRERQITILVSSHILSELYQLATKFAFLHKGQLLECLSATELDEKCKRHLLIRVSHTLKAAVAIEEQLKTTNFEISPSGDIRLYEFLDNPSQVSSLLIAQGIEVMQLSPEGDSLEAYYTRLIGVNR